MGYQLFSTVLLLQQNTDRTELFHISQKNLKENKQHVDCNVVFKKHYLLFQITASHRNSVKQSNKFHSTVVDNYTVALIQVTTWCM